MTLNIMEWNESIRENVLTESSSRGHLDCLVYLLDSPDYSWSTSSLHDAVRLAALRGKSKSLVHLLGHEGKWDRP